MKSTVRVPGVSVMEFARNVFASSLTGTTRCFDPLPITVMKPASKLIIGKYHAKSSF